MSFVFIALFVNAQCAPNTAYGGHLINLVPQEYREFQNRLNLGRACSHKLGLNERLIHDLELIMVGGFTPLSTFMGEADYLSVLSESRLANGLYWPLPITLDVTEQYARDLEIGSSIVCLTDDFANNIAALHVSEIFQARKTEESKLFISNFEPHLSRHWASHPSVRYIVDDQGPFLISGVLVGIQLPPRRPYKKYRLTPQEVRTEIIRRGFERTVAFQTRNPLHNAHVELAKNASERMSLLLHPVIGPTKLDDIPVSVRVRSYEVLIAEGVPPFNGNNFLFCLLPLAMRMGGPREAALHSIVRKNFGATSIIIGRDHAGCKDTTGADFYGPDEAREYVRSLQAELGIEMLDFDEFVYSSARQKYIERRYLYPDEEFLSLSGTKLRNILASGESPPEWFSDFKVVNVLRDFYLHPSKKGLVVFVYGRSGSGKSTLSEFIVTALENAGRTQVLTLDGDAIRESLSKDLGFDRKSREENLLRIGFVTEAVAARGGTVVVSAIAPYIHSRQKFRERIIFSAHATFFEIFVDTPEHVCAARDVKGLYDRVARGVIPGLGDFENPENPDMTVVMVGGNGPVSNAVKQLMRTLERKGVLMTTDSSADIKLEFQTRGYEDEGEFGQMSFARYLTNANGERLSYWHDVPLQEVDADSGSIVFNMVVEIPLGTIAKMEMDSQRSLNPIVHDTEKSFSKNQTRFEKIDTPRLYKHPLPIPVNYGFLPQTLGCDGDPMDAIDISGISLSSGSVVQVSVIGVLRLIDQGEPDDKIVVRSRLHNDVCENEYIEDFGLNMSIIADWFRTYKLYEGMSENSFAESNQTAPEIIHTSHESWKHLYR